MRIHQYNCREELSTEEQSDIIETAKFYDASIDSIECAIAYAMEDEEMLEEISQIADFGM